MAGAYPTLSKTRAERRLEELRADSLYPHHSREPLDEVRNPYVRQLAEGLEHIRGSMNRRGRGRRFDRYAARVIHESAPELPTLMQEDADFWRWLAVEQAPDIVEHRYGVDSLAGKGNFGIGSGRWDSLLMRLWFRADISFDSNGSDPYRLTKLGDVDFWASGVMRHRYGSSRNLVKAFVDYAYDDPRNPGQDRWQRAGEQDRDNGIRIVYKNLSRLHATVAYEVLSVEQCTDILRRLSENLPLRTS